MNCFYPYQLQFGDQVNTAAAGGNAAAATTAAYAATQAAYGVHYPHQIFPFSCAATSPAHQYYTPPISFAAPTNPMHSGLFN